ncbi:hypothetical protein TVNIR_1259 [Thioalkalivibrio nitratireducens DSM 14787]|uniref:Transmembrane protein n=1 Tax=Thioalkalivibrio nitratireducens (strain DSM 14787 / UNIQEM 213 / ALEN2) TaxID=1255043 RepID=L0DVA1_THIND|nr:hypothetical protein TVNIR_1259 [Thioalkalivibrio nitratireducens DSM 14787]
MPVQFLVTAPLFGVAFAVTLAWLGPENLQSRWMPGLLGPVHLLVIGYVATAMLGALQQLLPVLLGTPPAQTRTGGLLILALLAAGTAALAAGLAGTEPLLVRSGSALLPAAVIGFMAMTLPGLVRSGVRDAAALTVTLALLALGIATLLGLWIAAGHMGFGLGLPRHLTDVHLAWGLFGWIALLVAAVAVHVVPMFQITPPYPRAFVHVQAPALFMLLASYTILRIASAGAPPALPERMLEAGIAAWTAAFALLTLRVLAQRRRRLPDVTLDFWRLAMGALLGATVLWGTAQAVPGLVSQPALGLALGWLFLSGFAVSVVNGMLYKIVPFLVWLHLNRVQVRTGMRGVRIPNLHDAIPALLQRTQFLTHAVAVTAGLATFWLPWMFYPALFAFGGSSLLLWLNLVYALTRYRHALNAIERAGAHPTRMPTTQRGGPDTAGP